MMLETMERVKSRDDGLLMDHETSENEKNGFNSSGECTKSGAPKDKTHTNTGEELAN